MSSYLYPHKDHPLSHLQKFTYKWALPEELMDQIEFLKREFKFIDVFLGLQNFTNECNMLDAIQNVQALFQYAVAEFIRAVSGPDRSCSEVEKKIRETKWEIRSTYSFSKRSLPVSSKKDNIAAAPPGFVKKFIDVVVKNLGDLLKTFGPCSSLYIPGTQKQMEEVVKELMLLKDFVYFISTRYIDLESQRSFFTHVLAVGGHAAMVAWLNLQELGSTEMNVSLSELQMMIQPIQPCNRMIWIDVLQALKSKQSRWHSDIEIEYAADCEAIFVDTLVHRLEVLPIIGKNKEVVLKHEKTLLQEMLILLRANLIDLPKADDVKSILQDVDAAIIDAVLLVVSLYDSVEEKEDMVVPVLEISGKIQSMQAVIYLVTRKSFLSSLPMIDKLGSIDNVLANLKEFLSLYLDSLASMKSHIQTIQKDLEHFQKLHDGLQYAAIHQALIAKEYEVEHIVVACINKDIPQWCLDRWIRDISEEITILMREASEIHEKKVADLVLRNTSDVSSAHTSQFARITSMKEEMVGFDEVVEKLRRQLIRGSSELDVISIVGMAGLGKTTLANKLYLDQLVVSHFDVRAQCCVSQVYTRKDLLLAIFRGVQKDTIVSDKLPDNELADKLRRILLVRRYLILVDDVWETIAWDDLKPCFCDANNGSRIILTTRLADVASHARLDSEPLFLRLFTPKESWMLLENKVFNGKSCPLVLKDVGQKIAQKCGGLPLSVVLVAGILETMEKEKNCWEQVAINLGPHIQAKSEDIIELSYQDLPFHLKPCFLYFGVFLEDEEMQVSKLTWLWTAEGLVKAHTEKLSEDIAEYYLENLIGRNLVMVSKKSSGGKTKACRIHDLLLDFCRKKAKVENFLQCIKGNNIMNPSSISHQKHNIPRRLFVYFQGDNLAEWSSVCLHVQSFHLMKGRQIASSSISRASHTFNSFKFLRVLDLEFTVIDSFPEALTRLRYVAVRISEDSSLSFSINLRSIETLIIKGLGGRVSLPHTIWKMAKLRHLHVYNHAILAIDSVSEFLEIHPKMIDLRTFSSACFSCVEDADNILANTPNLQKLRCEVFKCDGVSPAFNNLTKLESLKFSCGPASTWATQLNFPQNLMKLTLSNVHIRRLNQVATLPRLAVLKLLRVTFYSKVWKVTDEQFPQLKFLKLQSPSFSEWNASDDAFPSLEHLVLRRCRYLKEIPSHFEYSSSLRSVEIISCNEALAKSAMAVRKTLIDNLGTSGFEVFVHK